MKQGHFYFIKDDFYLKYDKQQNLPKNKNKENNKSHNRPCFYAFSDKKRCEVLWIVPVSSKIEKFKAIVNKKIEKQRGQSIKNPKCNTICFGKLLGRDTAFLIQNMFPITQKYILNEYIDKNTGNVVTLDKKTEKNILYNARQVLKLVERGISNPVFSDILSIKASLLEELDSKNLETRID